VPRALRIVSSGGGESETLPTNLIFGPIENIFAHHPSIVAPCIKNKEDATLKSNFIFCY
jgi:hypothetical protein